MRRRSTSPKDNTMRRKKAILSKEKKEKGTRLRSTMEDLRTIEVLVIGEVMEEPEEDMEEVVTEEEEATKAKDMRKKEVNTIRRRMIIIKGGMTQTGLNTRERTKALLITGRREKKERLSNSLSIE